MSEAPKDPTLAFAEELAKQLPVKAAYRDVVKPGAKQAGQLVQDMVKTIQLALAPLQFAGAYQDRLRAFIDRAVRTVPEANRLSPPPQILGPIVESIRYEPEGTPLDEMFSKLLGTSMNKETVQFAHPAYVLIVKQLSPDEAKVLSLLTKGHYLRVAIADYDSQTNWFAPHKTEKEGFPLDQLSFPDNLDLYIEHLNHLGLAELIQVGNQEALFAHPNRPQSGVRITRSYKLTAFGQSFMRACT